MADRPPNVLFIITDQQRYDTLGARGNPVLHTPNLDRLCREGVRFDQAYCTQAICSPARASIFSGLFPHSHGIQENLYGVEDAFEMPEYRMNATWIHLLRSAGYRTGYVGKWHLGDLAPKCFDEWLGFNSLLSHWMGEFEHSRYRSDQETDQGLDFLERNRREPFMLIQSYYPPHTPYTAPEEYVRLYRDTDLRPAEYYGAVSDIDMNVGRLLDRLDDLGLRENTLVIFMSDHGDHFGARPGGAHKRSAYDDCARVPLVIRCPGVFEGGRVDRFLTSDVDLMPTILAVTGVEPPEGLQGVSLLSEERGASCSLVIENAEAVDESEEITINSRAVVTETRKLILREGPVLNSTLLAELYDRAADPLETENIFETEDRSGVEALLRYLGDWAAKTGDAVGPVLAESCRRDILRR